MRIQQPVRMVALAVLLLCAGCVQPLAATQPTIPAATGPTATPTATRPEQPASQAETPTPPSEPTATPDTPPAPTVIPEETPVPQVEVSPTPDAERLALGIDVYKRQACGVCHTLASVGTQGAFGPPHDDMAETASRRITEERYTGAATSPEEYIRESILKPAIFLTEGYQITRFPMPIYATLSAAEVDALVYLLMQPPASAP